MPAWGSCHFIQHHQMNAIDIQESHSFLQVLAGSGVIFLLIIVIVWYWSTRPLPTKDI